MPTIALVDDDRNILTSVSIALEAEGYRIQTYTDGASALDGLRQTPPDLAIFDIKMPRMDGMELLRRLRQKSDLPVIFLTSKDEEIDELFGLDRSVGLTTTLVGEVELEDGTRVPVGGVLPPALRACAEEVRRTAGPLACSLASPQRFEVPSRRIRHVPRT